MQYLKVVLGVTAVFTYIRIEPSRICPGPVTATSLGFTKFDRHEVLTVMGFANVQLRIPTLPQCERFFENVDLRF